MIEVGHDITYLLYFYSATAQTLGAILGTGLISLALYATWFSRKKTDLIGQLPKSDAGDVQRRIRKLPSTIPAFEFGCGLVIASLTIIASLFMLSVIDSPRVAELNSVIYTVVLGCTVVSLIIFGYVALHVIRTMSTVISIDNELSKESNPQKNS